MKKKYLLSALGLLLLFPLLYGCKSPAEIKSSALATAQSAQNTASASADSYPLGKEMSAEEFVAYLDQHMMTSAELQDYFKRKGIKPATKENFNPEKLLYEVEGPLTNSKGVTITEMPDPEDTSSDGHEGTILLHFTRDGKVVQNVKIRNVWIDVSRAYSMVQQGQKNIVSSRPQIFIARNQEHAAIMDKTLRWPNDPKYYQQFSEDNPDPALKTQYVLTYFDGEGKILWKKEFDIGEAVKMTQDGKYFALVSDRSSDTPEAKIYLVNDQGEIIFRYKNFENMRDYENFGFSGDGRYFFALVKKLDEKGEIQELIIRYDCQQRRLDVEKTLFEIFKDKNIPYQCELSYDGKYIATRSFKRIRDWQGNVVLTLPETVYAHWLSDNLEFSAENPNNLVLIYTNQQKKIKDKRLVEIGYIFDLNENKVVNKIYGTSPLAAHNRIAGFIPELFLYRHLEWDQQTRTAVISLNTVEGDILFKDKHIFQTGPHKYLKIENKSYFLY